MEVLTCATFPVGACGPDPLPQTSIDEQGGYDSDEVSAGIWRIFGLPGFSPLLTGPRIAVEPHLQLLRYRRKLLEHHGVCRKVGLLLLHILRRMV